MTTTTYGHHQPDYLLTIGGQDITPRIEGLLMRLCLKESRGDEADQLDIDLDDSSGRVAIPPKGERISLRLGWAGQPLIDKGDFVVDESEHKGAPDVISIRARSADLRGELRTRREASYHQQTLGDVVRAIAARHGLTPRVAAELAAIALPHIDQTHESDLNFLTRLGRQHDAVATVKKGTLIFAPINSATTATGQPLPAVQITRADGDQHRWHAADRDTYTGVRATWQDNGQARHRHVIAGSDERTKRLRTIYGSEADALAAARAEQQRLARGAATFELTLALARPDIAPQSRASVSGWHKHQIDHDQWLVKTATHNMDGGQGFATQLELETVGSDTQATPDDDDPAP
ncbi:phage late control D family protein [Ottowia sp.]|uniref:phage late control D family protein n=1 Tax=Ottowia sp. TaxID=1898956 RepID=UPI003A85FAA1